jgi:hypothetical protein
MNEEVLKSLLEKYYDGLSTAEEEQELRDYFSGTEVLPGYDAEAEIFRFYVDSADMPEPSADFESRIIKALDAETRIAGRPGIRRYLVPSLSAAAGLMILVASWFFLLQQKKSEDTFSDPKIAYAETMKILMDVSSKMNQGTRTLKPVGRIHDLRTKTLGPISKSTGIIEKNLKTLRYLETASEPADTSIE